jgi:hypothetical protein
VRPASPDESPDRLDGPVLRHGRAAGVRVDRAGPQGGKGLFAMCRTHAVEDSREPMDASVEHAGFLSSWVGPMLALGIGAVLWSVGGRVSRDALGVLGFAVGVPVGAITATWLGWIWLPPLAGAIVGAIGGLVLARVAYRLALIVVMTAASAALGAVICAALVDRGAVAAPDRKDEVAAQARATELADAMSDELQRHGDGRALVHASASAVATFWRSLDGPERTLVAAGTLASAAVGLGVALLVPAAAGVAATAMAGAVMLAWGLGQLLGEGGPGLATWAVATAVLAAAGMAVQAVTAPGRSQGGAAAPPAG